MTSDEVEGLLPGLRGTKIFAMLGRDGEMVVKLSKARVDQLATKTAGSGRESISP